MVIMRGKNYTFFVAGLVGFIGLACYPIIIEPMLNTDKYKQQQKINRAGVKQEEIQPGSEWTWSYSLIKLAYNLHPLQT